MSDPESASSQQSIKEELLARPNIAEIITSPKADEDRLNLIKQELLARDDIVEIMAGAGKYPGKNRKKGTPLKRQLTKIGLGVGATVVLISSASGLAGNVGAEIMASARQTITQQIKPSKEQIMSSPKKPKVLATTPEPSPTTQSIAEQILIPSPAPTPEPIPTLTAQEQAEEEIGDKNIAEYFLGGFIKLLKAERIDRFNNNPAVAERINGELLDLDNIFTLFLGIDETRERPEKGVWTGRGWGRSDVVMLVSFNPHTFKTTSISFPRDLVAPELERFKFSEGARINAVTMTPYVDPSADSFELAKQIIETATGWPVDIVVEGNIDLMQGVHYIPGFEEKWGVLDRIFPAGLEINVPREILDRQYPLGYGVITVNFKPGKQLLHGVDMTRYARSRHADSDFGRSERQRQILIAGMRDLFPRIMGDLILGHNATLDLIIDTLEDEADSDNLFYDVNFIEVLKNIKDNIQYLRSSPKGVAALTLLGANSADEISAIKENQQESFTSFGLARENGNVYNPSSGDTRLVVTGSSLNNSPTRLGNYLKYWEPIRRKVANLL